MLRTFDAHDWAKATVSQVDRRSSSRPGLDLISTSQLRPRHEPRTIERQGFLKLPDKKGGIALLIALFLILLGARAALINYAGSPTPFLDEWDGDAAALLKPYLQGRLTVGDLLAPFGE